MRIFLPRSTKMLTRAALIAALYTALTLLLAPLSFGMGGAVQLRVSEAFTLLPVLLPEAVPALFVGCLLANLLGGAALPDIVLGSLTTLLAAMLTYGLAHGRLLAARPKTLRLLAAATPPVLLNALVVGALVHVLYTPAIPLWLCMVYVGLGQAVACYGLGLLLISGLSRLPQRLLD